MIVFSCGYNCEKYVKNHIESLKRQTFKDFKHIMVDDGSTDRTSDIISGYPGIIHYRNETNQKWIRNALQYLSPNISEEDEVICVVDMDDWLAFDNVMDKINKIYTQEKNVWMTYSRFIYTSSGITSKWIPPYNPETLLNGSFRNTIWSYTHLRTFRAFLWKEIKDEDLKDHTGDYAKFAYDQVIFFPMLEMSCPTHIRFIPDVMYCYNNSNPIQVEKINRVEQEKTANYIRSKPPYKRLIR